MHLVACDTPHEPLEDAPRTALLADSAEGDRWDGFWSADSDAYFVRRTLASGGTEWYQLADDDVSPRRGAEPRVLTFRSKTRSQFVVAQSPSGRRMLVGTARRSSR